MDDVRYVVVLGDYCVDYSKENSIRHYRLSTVEEMLAPDPDDLEDDPETEGRDGEIHALIPHDEWLRLTREREEMEKIKRYARHNRWCPKNYNDGECDCGLSALIAKAEGRG